jgi:hypothetical protein
MDELDVIMDRAWVQEGSPVSSQWSLHRIHPDVHRMDPDSPWVQQHDDANNPVKFPSPISPAVDDDKNAGFPKNYSRMISEEVYDDQVRVMVEAIMNGDFQILFREMQVLANKQTDSAENPTNATSWVTKGAMFACFHHTSLPDTFEGQPPPFQCHLFVQANEDGTKGETVIKFRHDKTWNGKLSKQLERRLAFRVIHWFLRQYASKFQIMSRRFLLEYLLTCYSTERIWQDYLDVTVLSARYILNRKRLSDPPSAYSELFCHVAEALGALKRFDEAAAWYANLANTVFKGHGLEGVYLSLSGAVQMESGKYDIAQRVLVQALQRLASSNAKIKKNQRIDPTSPSFGAAFRYVLRNYSYMAEKEGGDESMSHCPHNQFITQPNHYDQVMSFLVIVLYYAGPPNIQDSGVDENFEFISTLPEHEKDFIKQKVKSKKGAQQVLYQACSKGTVRDFESVILRVGIPGRVAVTATFRGQPSTTKEREKIARNLISLRATKQGIEAPTYPCNSCGKQEVGCQACPCQTVYYCCKDCQVAHWKAGHKYACPKFGKQKTKKEA